MVVIDLNHHPINILVCSYHLLKCQLVICFRLVVKNLNKYKRFSIFKNIFFCFFMVSKLLSKKSPDNCTNKIKDYSNFSTITSRHLLVTLKLYYLPVAINSANIRMIRICSTASACSRINQEPIL
jgi:hypothetical protein